MRPRSPLVAVLTMLALVACRHRVTSAPAPPADGYCWWTAWRTALPPDSVALHFVAAYRAAGLRDATWTARGDTAWVHAGPAVLEARGGAVLASRVVAFRRGDTTLFRPYASVSSPSGAARDSSQASGDNIGFCQDLMRAAATHATAPREPGADERLDVWHRYPQIR